MRRLLAWLMLACMLGAACAEGDATEYECPYFSMRLPTGMRVIAGDLKEGLSTAALADSGAKRDICLMLALDEEHGRGMDILMPESAINMDDFTTIVNIDGWTAGMRKVSVDEYEYVQACLYNDDIILIITFYGMTVEECDETLKTIRISA